jgi:hypothetical protein
MYRYLENDDLVPQAGIHPSKIGTMIHYHAIRVKNAAG